MNARTPSPWHFLANIGPTEVAILEADGAPAFVMRKPREFSNTYSTLLPNAAFVVMACNVHDELVAALGDAIIQAQKDALKLGNSVHGRHLHKLADQWLDLFYRATGTTRRLKKRQ